MPLFDDVKFDKKFCYNLGLFCFCMWFWEMCKIVFFGKDINWFSFVAIFAAFAFAVIGRFYLNE